MKQETLKRLCAFFQKNPTLCGKAASHKEIEDAEKELDVVMDKDYREVIEKFGGAYAGLDIHAFSNGSSIGKETVIELTNNARSICNEVDIFPEINESLVIADDGSGNPIAVVPDGKVVLFDYDVGERQILADSFEKLIDENFFEW